MQRLRWIIVAFVLVLSFFFNIERLDIEQSTILNIDSTVYALATGLIILTLSFPAFRQLSTASVVASGTIFYFIYKFGTYLVLDAPPFFSGNHLYVTISELTFLLLLITIAYRVSLTLGEFEEAVESITFVDTGIKKIVEANDDIEAEMFRSRHNNHPLSVIVIEPETSTVKSVLNRMIKEAQEGMINYYLVNTLAQELKRQLRRTDLVLVNGDAHRVVLICPETDAEDSVDLVDFLRDNIKKRLDFSVACGIASFPNEALTFDELVYMAEKDLYADVPKGSTGFFERTAVAPA